MELVSRGMVADIESARDLVSSGRITVSKAPAINPGHLVSRADVLGIVNGDQRPFPSRAGLKLDAALERFGVDVTGSSCLDAGAATGGFSACLLRRGAARVTAVDVGYGLIHESLRGDPRVTLMERTNLRSLCAASGGPAPGIDRYDVVVADLSFVSLTTLVPILARDLPREGADLVWLVKPQFESDRVTVSRGKGVVTDPNAWTTALVGVASALMSQGSCIMDAMPSPIRGSKGNVEFLLHARAVSGVSPPSSTPTGSESAIVRPIVDAAVDEALRTYFGSEP